MSTRDRDQQAELERQRQEQEMQQQQQQERVSSQIRGLLNSGDDESSNNPVIINK